MFDRMAREREKRGGIERKGGLGERTLPAGSPGTDCTALQQSCHLWQQFAQPKPRHPQRDYLARHPLISENATLPSSYQPFACWTQQTGSQISLSDTRRPVRAQSSRTPLPRHHNSTSLSHCAPCVPVSATPPPTHTCVEFRRLTTERAFLKKKKKPA